MEMDWKKSYMGRFISIKFTDDEVISCIESFVKELNQIATDLGISGDVVLNNDFIYFKDCNIRFEVQESRIDFIKEAKNSRSQIGSASIIKIANKVNLFSNHCKLDKNLELIDFDLCRAIDVVIGCLLIKN